MWLKFHKGAFLAARAKWPVIGPCAEQVLEIATLWWHGFSHRSLPGRKQKKGNKEGLGEKGGRQEGIDTELGEEPELASSRLMYERGFI